MLPCFCQTFSPHTALSKVRPLPQAGLLGLEVLGCWGHGVILPALGYAVGCPWRADLPTAADSWPSQQGRSEPEEMNDCPWLPAAPASRGPLHPRDSKSAFLIRLHCSLSDKAIAALRSRPQQRSTAAVGLDELCIELLAACNFSLVLQVNFAKEAAHGWFRRFLIFEAALEDLSFLLTLLACIPLRGLEFWELKFRSKSFLYRQVRRMVGALVAVGQGKLTPHQIKELLELRDARALPPHAMAPPAGLFLKCVEYNEADLHTTRAPGE
eukprot:XP_021122401.2 tRNA pseudouridine synthase-like 1 isoform X3 [Anas platyrhynchos]